MAKKNDLVPVAALDGSCVWMPSKDAAALTALERLPYGKQEFSGALYKNKNGEWCYSNPVPGTDDNFTFKTEQSPDYTFDGIYHTHPGGENEQKFSPNDVNVADQLKRTSYIRANDSGEVKRYEPGGPRNRDKRPGSMARMGFELGTSLGNLRKQDLAALIQALQPSTPQPQPMQAQVAAQLLAREK